MAYEFPPKDNSDDTTASKVVAYQVAACYKDDPARVARWLEAEQIRFTVASKPWMAVATNPQRSGHFMEPIATTSKVKLANRNEMAPILDGEVARLIGSTSEPSVVPQKPTTIVHRAAKKAKMVLDDILLRASWTTLLGLHAKNVKQYGTSHLLSGWENDYSDKREVPAKVHACDSPTCGIDPKTGIRKPWTMLALGGEPQAGGGFRYSGDMAREMIEAGIGNTVSQIDDELPFATLHVCPECKGPLVDRMAMPEDGDADAFGYSLRSEQPLAKVFVRQYPDTDVFAIGGGRVTHGFCGEVTIEEIVPIDWLLPRYEGAREVQPVALSEIEETARYHPSGLEMWGYSGHGLSNDQKRWAVLRTTLRQPFFDPKNPENDEPLGRLMISANKTCLVNGPLMFETKDVDGGKKLIPRMRLFTFANEMQNASLQGLSVSSRLLNPQMALDAMYTQFQFDMATNGSPQLAAPKGANMEGQGDGYEEDDSSSFPNQVILYDSDAGEPKVISGQVTHHDWVPFTDKIVEHMQRTTGQSQLDRGEAVRGAPSATAQITIGQRLDETRKPTGQRWAEHLSALFSYDLDCVCAVYLEKRQFLAVDDLNNRTVRDFTGADLMGQTNVKVATKPAHDTEAFQRQNILELLPLGLIDISTPRQKLRVMKKLGASDELEPEPNQQIQEAQNQWLDFIADPPVDPVAKKRTDNHDLCIQQNMEDLRSPDGEPFRRWWNMHEVATEGVFEQMKALLMAEQRLKMNPAPRPVEILDPETQMPDMKAMEDQIRAYAEDQALIAKIESMPKNLQARVTQANIAAVQKHPEFIALTPEDQSDAIKLTKWLALCDTRQLYLLEQQAANAPTPVAAETPGNQPVAPPAKM